MRHIRNVQYTKIYIKILYIVLKRINQTIHFLRKKEYFIQKIYKNQSKKLLQWNLIRIVIIKFKNLKIFDVFIITIYEKIWVIVFLKQNVTPDFVSVCFNCVALYFKHFDKL